MDLNTLVAKNAPTSCKGIMLAVGMCSAVFFGIAIDMPAMSPFAAFGAMIAMEITPRHGVKAKIIGALAGCLFLLLAASLSVAVARLPFVALCLLFGLSWLAALPKKDLAYIGFVTKCAAMAVLLSYFDFSLSLAMGVYFCAGIIIGVFLSLSAMAFEHQDQKRPIDQLRALLHGDINNPWYSLLTPVTVLASSLAAKMYAYANPAWVGLTVIFVANTNDTLELKKLLERILGTIAGAVISYFILSHIQMPLRLVLIVGALAFLIPFFLKYYGIFSLLMTCIVLLLINIAMQGHGNGMDLILWRCVDTVFGCLCVLASNLILKYIYWRKEHKTHAPQQKNRS